MPDNVNSQSATNLDAAQPRCLDCGTPYAAMGLDVVLSNDQWALLMGAPPGSYDPGGILCANCIVKRAEAIGAFVRARMVLECD